MCPFNTPGQGKCPGEFFPTAAAAAALLHRVPFLSRPRPPSLVAASQLLSVPVRRQSLVSPPIGPSGTPKPQVLHLVACSASSFDEFDAKIGNQEQLSKKSILLTLIQEIEPLDVKIIQKDVPINTVDAMKRTISGMLGLLPSNQFKVLVEALWEPLFKLLVSSMKTGYAMRNAEYRLCLEKNLDIHEEYSENGNTGSSKDDSGGIFSDGTRTMSKYFGEYLAGSHEYHGHDSLHEENSIKGGGGMTAEAKEYIQYLQSRLNYVEKELLEIKRKNSALQMQQFIGEEKNDLLDYLRSLQPEKVAELSEPTCTGVEEAIHTVVHGLLATLSPTMHTKPTQSGNIAGGTLNIGKDDCSELVENTSIQFQPLISVTRDYLARLLFWCMLLGHYLRRVEYHLELMQLFTISGSVETISQDIA